MANNKRELAPAGSSQKKFSKYILVSEAWIPGTTYPVAGIACDKTGIHFVTAWADGDVAYFCLDWPRLSQARPIPKNLCAFIDNADDIYVDSQAFGLEPAQQQLQQWLVSVLYRR